MASMQLQHLKGSTYLISAPASAGLYTDGKDAYLIDSGNNREAGRQIRAILDKRGLKLRAIINTHAHADHIGGNSYLQKRSDCAIAAPALESPMVSSPKIEGEFLWGGGAHPGLNHPMVKASPSRVTAHYAEGPVAHTPLEALSLPGHSLDMMALSTPDNILFTADALMPIATLKKYPLFYIYHLGDHFLSLQKLSTAQAALFVPSHGQPVEDLGSLMRMNRTTIEETLDMIIRTSPGKTLEELTAAVSSILDIRMNHVQYALIRCTVSAYLGYALVQKLLTLSYVDNQPLIEGVLSQKSR